MRKFDKKRLAKLVFWLVHIFAIGALVLVVVQIKNYPSFEKAMLSNNKDCLSHYTSADAFRGLSVCSPILEATNDYNLRMSSYLIFGIGLLMAYWIIRFLYVYLFPKNILALKNNLKTESEVKL